MTITKLLLLFTAVLGGSLTAQSQSTDPCAALTGLKINGVEITKAAVVPAGTTIPPPYPGAPSIGPLPSHCRVDGVINRRKGAEGQEFGIGFALALPENAAWNGDFMMQGGGGGNGVVAYPAGANYAGDKPALSRGFAVASTDTGHKAKTGPFDFSFMRDQQAYLDFAFLANAEVAGVAKQIIAHYYAKPAAYSYFVGCSTGGREGMILSQRYPTVFNGIVSGDPAMRTGLSNLAIAQWIPVAYNQAAPKDASGKPQIDKFLTDADRKLFMDALMKQCDAKDGVADGMISDPLGCDFDPAVLACKPGQTDACIAPEKTTAIKKAFAGPKNAYGTPADRNVEYQSPHDGASIYSLIRLRMLNDFPLWIAMRSNGTQGITESFPHFENSAYRSEGGGPQIVHGEKLAMYFFMKLLDSPYSRHLARCDNCKSYFAYERAPKRTIKHGVFCLECKVSGSVRRTKESRDRKKDKMLEVAAAVWGKWRNSRNHPDQREWIAKQVNKECGTAVHREWVSRNLSNIREKAEELQNATRKA